MLDLLQPVTHTDENMVGGQLPSNPTAITKWQKQCDYCSDAVCQCRNAFPSCTVTRHTPTGIQAAAAAAGGLAYKAGEFMGMLAGEIVDASYEPKDNRNKRYSS
jgi:hypothetical protein